MILVTGATGKVGQHVVRELAARGQKPRLFLRDPAKAGQFKGIFSDVAQGDFDTSDTIAKALGGADAVFLVTPVDQRQAAWEKAFVDAAKAAGVKRLVYLSAIGAAPDSPMSLGRAHATVETYLKASGIPWTILQPNSYMQNFLNDAATIRSQGAIYYSADQARVSFIDTRDIGAAAAVALTEDGHAGKTYLLTGPEPVTYREAAALIGKAIGKPVKCAPVSEADAKKAMIGAGMPEWFVDDLIALQGMFKAGRGAVVTTDLARLLPDVPRTVDDFAKAYAAQLGRAA
jgi:uncharacterized protein YbjT (DUF2867 family)